MISSVPAVIVPAFIPSPSQGVWHLGPIPLRAYALCILAGIFAGYWLGRKRWVARGGSAEVLLDIIFWAVPFGLVGARIYHVLTDWQRYFGEGSPDSPIDALKIWHGGLGIWGAIAFGAFGAWLACRQKKVPFLAVADAMAPGIALAQVFGRFGNYFNQELFGRPTTRWWGLEIDSGHRPLGYEQFATFHPTFLYEAVWNLAVIALVIVADRRFKLGHGRAFALYVAGYTAGRAWIETMRIDEADHVAGLRLNVWTSIILFVAAVIYFVISARLRPGQEDISSGPSAGKPSDSAAAEVDAGDTSAAGAAEGADDAVDEAAAEPASESDPSARDTAKPTVDANAVAGPASGDPATPGDAADDGPRD